MYLIEKHMCCTLKKKNSYISHCFLFQSFLPSFIKIYVVRQCWRLATPFVKLFKWGHRVSFVYCLEWRHGNKVGVFMNAISHSHATTTTSFSLPLSVNPAAALEERPGHYEMPLMSVWRGVACCDARHITAIHQSWETLDRRTANRLCNHITQPCQACHSSVSHSGL